MCIEHEHLSPADAGRDVRQAVVVADVLVVIVSRMIPPHGLEVTYDKTVHVIFPAEVRYVDLPDHPVLSFAVRS